MPISAFRHDNLHSIVLAVLVALAGALSVQADDLSQYGPKEMERLWDALEGQVSGLKVQFEVRDAVVKNLIRTDLMWDLGGDSLNGVSLVELANGKVSTEQLVMNESKAWNAHPEKKDGKYTGTWHVDMCDRRDFTTPQMIVASRYSLNLLKYGFSPLHRVLDTKGFLPEGRSLQFKGVTPGGDSSTYQVFYELMEGDARIGGIEYQLDVRDGITLVHTKATISTDKGEQLIWEVVCDEFEKKDGVWFPRSITERTWDASGVLDGQRELLIANVSLNPTFDTQDFVYRPGYGSKVYDQQIGIAYRVGYENPAAPLGSDQRPSAVELDDMTLDDSASSEAEVPDTTEERPVTVPASSEAQESSGSWFTPMALIVAVVVLVAVCVFMAMRKGRNR